MTYIFAQAFSCAWRSQGAPGFRSSFQLCLAVSRRTWSKNRRPPGDVTEHLASLATSRSRSTSSRSHGPSWWSSGACDCGWETASSFPPATFGAEDLERHALDLLGCHNIGFRSGCLCRQVALEHYTRGDHSGVLRRAALKARSAVLHLEGREGLAAHLVASQSTWRRRRAPGGLAWRALLAGGGQHLANA